MQAIDTSGLACLDARACGILKENMSMNRGISAFQTSAFCGVTVSMVAPGSKQGLTSK
jgi:hypothetical protein